MNQIQSNSFKTFSSRKLGILISKALLVMHEFWNQTSILSLSSSITAFLFATVF